MAVDIGEGDATWNSFIQSLDVGPEKAQGINQLPEDQKRQLLQSYTLSSSKCSAFHSVTLIKGLRSGRISLPKSRKGAVQTAKRVLSATEISLRTNNVSWVYEFLDSGGLDALQDYLSKSIHVLLRDENTLPPTTCRRRNCSHGLVYSADNSHLYFSDGNEDIPRSYLCQGRKRHSRSTTRKQAPAGFADSVLDGIHQGIKCYRALLNNQRGCTMTFEHPESIETIALCLFHPNFQTKTLVLELLAAVCLIVGGHERIVRAFELIRADLGEVHRFESLFYFFRTHERTPAEEYSIDFVVSCMQFINIVVHSTENITLRVFLQQEFINLGLEDYLRPVAVDVRYHLNSPVRLYPVL
ncbi:Formin-like protein 2 [Sparganum proliferum]